ncbi:hypothetical protein [Stakelama tenebrarum]|uniref:Uncharacterized protein n=1 Tax=Stakelama tenebrarum TaxID=2711215 RepID=A0A6G6Y7C0_9SPHN|nr:hypothetical protein [Sphingosinithalassobacter tenebrarum]QIG80608.1 hypothetical protein G5C33_12990 [Sphingosinithalassobacter tenebrarum]
MRNAMICVSIMLAVFLGWPLAFGGNGEAGYGPQLAKPDSAAAAQVQPTESPTAAVADTKGEPEAASHQGPPESCYNHYQRAVRLCPANRGAGCRLKAADDWDLCEARGIWPED